METYLQRLRREQPDLFFDGRGAALSDQDVVEKLLKDVPKKYQEQAKLGLYMPAQEPTPEPEKPGVMAGVTRLAENVGKALLPKPSDPVPGEDESVGDYLRRSEPKLAKASDKGLARYLKITYNLEESLDDISSKAKDYARGNEEFLARLGRSVAPGAQYGPFATEQDAQPETQQSGLLDAWLSGARSAREDLASIEQNVVRPAAGVAEARSLESLLAAPVQMGAEAIRKATDPGDIDATFKENLRKAADKQAALARQRSSETRTSQEISDKLYQIQLDLAKKADPAFAMREEFRNKLAEQTTKVTAPLFEQAQVIRSELPEQKAIPEFIDQINKAKTPGDVVSSFSGLLGTLATTPEGLVLVAEQFPTVAAALLTKSPTLAAGGGSLTQRVGAELAALSPEERIAKVGAIVEQQAPGAVIDAATAGLISKIVPQSVRSAKGYVGQQVATAGLEGAGGAAAEFAVNPNASVGELTAEAVTEALLGRATEAGPAALTAISPEIKARAEALKQSPDLLDQTEAAILEVKPTPPEVKEEAKPAPNKELVQEIAKATSAPVQQELPLGEVSLSQGTAFDETPELLDTDILPPSGGGVGASGNEPTTNSPRPIGLPQRFSQRSGDGSVQYMRRADGRVVRTITYDDGETITDTLVTDRNGDETWVTQSGYEQGEFYPVQLTEEQAARFAAEDASGLGVKPGATDAAAAQAPVEAATGAPVSPEQDAAVESRLRQMNQGRIRDETLAKIDQGVPATQAFRETVTEARQAKRALGGAGALARELNFDIAESPASSTKTKLQNAVPADPVLQAAATELKRKGLGNVEFTPAAAPNTAAAKHAQDVATTLGVELRWMQQNKGTSVVNGFTPGGRVAYVNVASTKPVDFILGHETNHVLERKPEYKSAVQKALAAFANETGLETAIIEKRGRYSPEKAIEEIRSDLFGDAIKDPVFYRALKRATGDTTTYQRVVDFIKDTLDRIVGKITRRSPGDRSAQVLKDVNGYRAAVLKAIQDSGKAVESAGTTEFDIDSGRGQEPQQSPFVRESRQAVKILADNMAGLVRARGVAAPETQAARIRDQANKTAIGREHQLVHANLERARKKAKISPEALNAMLQGAPAPASIANEVQAARNELDRQTMVLMEQIGDPKKIKTLEANKGKYLSKSYHAWENPAQWERAVHTRKSSTGQTLWDYALTNIKENMVIPPDLGSLRAPQLERLARYWDVPTAGGKDSIISQLETIRQDITPETMDKAAKAVRQALVNPSKARNVPLIDEFKSVMQGADSILKETTTPEWVREVWGEVKDGSYNFLVTAERQAALISKLQVYDRLAAQLLSNGRAVRTKQEGFIRVPNSEANGPLAGLYVREEDWDFIQQVRGMDKISDAFDNNPALNWWPALNSAFKAANVVYDHSSVVVQVTSSLANSLYFAGRPPMPMELARAFKTAVADTFYKGVSPEQRAAVREQIELGVASEGVWSGEARAAIRDILRDERSADASKNAKPVDLNPIEMARSLTSSLGKLWAGAKKGSAVFQKAIQFGDTFSRSIVYEIELSRQKRYNPELTANEHKERAAAITRNIMPTMSQTAPLAKAIGKSGFGNPFMTFVWEVHRNAANNTVYGMRDVLYGKTVGQKMDGLSRLAATSAALYVMGSYVLNPLGESIASAMRDDYEEDKDKELKEVDPELLKFFVPDYYENNAGLVPIGMDEAGVLTYINPARFNAYEPMWQVLTHGLDGDYGKAAEAWKDAVWGGGFLGNLMQHYLTYESLEDDGQLFLADQYLDKAVRDAESLYPGAVRRLTKVEKAKQKGDPITSSEFISEQLGMTVHKVNLRDSARAVLSNWSQQNAKNKADARELGRTSGTTTEALLGAITGDTVSAEDVNKAYAAWYRTNLETFQEASEKMNAYQQVLSKDVLAEIAKEAKVSKDNLRSLLTGTFSMPKIEDELFEKEMERAVKQAGTNEEGKRKAREKWATIRRQFKAAEREFRDQMRSK